MKRFWLVLKEMIHLIRANKMYAIAPIVIAFALLVLFAFVLGPNAVLTFIYAGF